MIVHRLLSAALGLSNLPPQLRDRPTLTSVSDSRALILYSSNFYIGHLHERTSSKLYTLNISCGCNSMTGGQSNVCGKHCFCKVLWPWIIFSHSAPRCADLNYRHRNAQMAGRASVELHTVIFFKKRLVSEKLNST